MIKNQKGITLITLVVTIIVLLILAGISITMLSGDNKILSQAAESKERTENVSQLEMVKLAVLASIKEDTSMDEELLLKELSGSGFEVSGDSQNGWTAISNDKGYFIDTDKSVKETNWVQKSDGTIQCISDSSKVLTIGDYIDYDPTDGALKLTEKSELNGYGAQEFVLSSYEGKWRLLGIDKGNLLVISSNIIGPDTGGYIDETTGNKYFYIKGTKGHRNAIAELEKISDLYGQGKYAIDSRSVKIEDINKITGYNANCVGIKNPTQEQIENGTPYAKDTLSEYGAEITFYWQGTNYPYYLASNKLKGSMAQVHSNGFYYFKDMWYASRVSSTATTTQMKEITKIKNNYYIYYPETLSLTQDATASIGISQSSPAYDLLFANTDTNNYWLASNFEMMMSNKKCVLSGIRTINGGYVNGYALVYSYAVTDVDRERNTSSYYLGF